MTPSEPAGTRLAEDQLRAAAVTAISACLEDDFDGLFDQMDAQADLARVSSRLALYAAWALTELFGGDIDRARLVLDRLE
jgi:hypothetical protein